MLLQHQANKQHQTSHCIFTQENKGPQQDGYCLFPQAEALHTYSCFLRRPYRWKGWGHRATLARHRMGIQTNAVSTISHA